MNKIYLSLAILLSWCGFQKCNATHMMGTDMSYICLGNGKYRIIAKVYRDCRGISFNGPTFGVYAGNSGSNSCGDFPLSITRTAIYDVSQLCPSVPSQCDTNRSNSGEGVEMHVFEVTVDFNNAPLSQFKNNSSCCDVTFYFGQCCRNAAITTGPGGNDFWTTCTINLCNTGSDCNSSPVFSNIPIFFACCNKPYYYNHGITDSTFADSISFSLSHGYSTRLGGSVNYTGPFTYKYPLTPYCTDSTITCKPNPGLKPPTGFYFHGGTGEMVFTPIKCSEVALIAVEAIEYKKSGGVMLELGRVRRDMQVIVENCPNNMIPEIYGPDSICAGEGDTISFEISTLDTLTGSQTSGDSLSMSWNSGIQNAQFSIISSGKNPKGKFYWVVPAGSTRGMAYNFSIKVADNNCPRVALAYKGFSIYVNNCGQGLGNTEIEKSDPIAYPVPVRSGEILHFQSGVEGAFSMSDLQGREILTGFLSADHGIDIPRRIQSGTYTIEFRKQGAIQRCRILISN